MSLEELKNYASQSIEDFDKSCQRTTDLIKKLRSKQTTFVDCLNNIVPEDYKNKLSYIKKERHVQCIIQKKLMDVNLELEALYQEISFESLFNTLDKETSNTTENKVLDNANLINDSFTIKEQEVNENHLPLQHNEGALLNDKDEHEKLNINKKYFVEEEKSLKNNTSNSINDKIQIKDKEEKKSKKLTGCSGDVIHSVLLHNEIRNNNNKMQIQRTPDLSYKLSDKDVKKMTEYIKNDFIKPKKITSCDVISFPVLNQPKVPVLNSICAVSYVESPSEFYVAVGNEPFHKLHLLTEEICQKYDNSDVQFKSKTEVKKCINTVCAAFSVMYNTWYRAILQDLKMDSEEDDVVVKFIDYGNFETIPLANIRTISKKFCKLPIVSHKCHLAHLYPNNWKKGDKCQQWTEDVSNKFKEMINENIYILCYVTNYIDDDSISNDSLAVDLLALDSHDGKTIGEELILNEMAIEIIDDIQIPVEVKDPDMVAQIMKAQGQEGIKEGMSETDALEIFFKNDKTDEPANINEAVTNYSGKDDERICKFMLTRGSCPRKHCTYEHTPYAKNLITMDKEAVYASAICDLVLPKEGEDVNLKITYVKNACQFYAIQEVNLDEMNETSLPYLVKLMNNKDTIKKYRSLTITPSIGQIVLVYNEFCWLRAKVIDYVTTQNDTFKVFLVDYGDEIEVKLLYLREMIKEFLHLPFQAVLCYLSNVSINKNSNVTDGKTLFESRYLSETLRAEVTSSNLMSLQVILYDQCNEDVGTKLIENGYAIKGDWSFKTASSLILID